MRPESTTKVQGKTREERKSENYRREMEILFEKALGMNLRHYTE